MKKSNKLSDLLEVWGVEHDLIIFRDNSLGFILECQALDISCRRDEFINHLGTQVRQFLNGLPQFLDIQFVQEIDKGSESVIRKHGSLGKESVHALTKLVLAERIKRFSDLEEANLLPTHRLKIVVRRKIPSLVNRPKFFSKKQDFEVLSEAVLLRETKATLALRDTIIQELQALGVASHSIYDKEIYTLLYWQWNPERGLPPRERFDPSDLRNEIIFSDILLNNQGFSINGIHHRVLTLKLLPDLTYSGMAEKFQKLPFASRLYFSVRVPDQQKEIDALKMQRRIAFSMVNGRGGAVRDLDSEAKFQDLETLLSELISQGERVFQVAVNIVLRSPSEDELSSQVTETLSLFREMSGSEGMQETLAAFDLFTGFSVPNARANERVKRMKTSSVSDLLPIFGSWKGHESPSVLLRSRIGGLIKFDPFSPTLTNFNHVISGGSGSGKSFLTNLILLQLMKEEPKVYIVDIGGSYKKISDLLCGQYIPLGMASGLSINPFDLSRGETEPSPEKVKFLVGLVELMTKEEDEGRLPRLTRAEIEEAIFKVYERVKNPHLSDLKAELEKHPDIEIRRFSRILSSWCGKSAYGEFVDRDTTIHLDKKLVCFDLKGLDSSPDLQRVCLYLITDYVWREVQRDRSTKKFLIFDECWKLLENEAGSTFIAEVYRTFRKYYASAIAISQNMDDFAKSKVAGAILSNSSTKWCLSQKGADQERLKEVLQLNDNELLLIGNLKKKHGVFSEAFLMCSDDRSVVSIESTPLEYWIATTDARDLSVIERLENSEPALSKIEVLQKLSKLYPTGAAGTQVGVAT